MAITPYIINGIITDTDGNAIAGAVVVANDITQNTYPTVVTDSNGRYVIDLANGGAWSVGDSINVYVRDGKYVGETSFTLSGSGGIEKDITVNFITLSTIRDKSWLMLYNLIQTGTYAISTDNIFGAMNDKLISKIGYPVVIIEPPKITNSKLVITREGVKEKLVSFNIMIYNTSAENVKVLADEVENKIDTGWKVLAGSGLKSLEFPEGDSDWFDDGDEGTIHIMNIPVRFRYTGN